MDMKALWRIRYESGREVLCHCRTYVEAIAYAETCNDEPGGGYKIKKVVEEEEKEEEKR